MFNAKLKDKVNDLDKAYDRLYRKIDNYGELSTINPTTGEVTYKNVGLKQKVEKLEAENQKLKAIVAELCDYVYKDNK